MHNWTTASVYQLEMNYKTEAVILFLLQGKVRTKDAYTAAQKGHIHYPIQYFPLPISIFLITSFQFGYFSFPILSFLITNFQFGYFSFLPV